jgi:phosphatidylglycerol lysyltransferase
LTAVQHRPGRIGTEPTVVLEPPPPLQAPPPPGAPRGRPRLPGPARRLWQRFRRAPVTICYLVTVWVVGLVSGSVAHGPSRWLAGHVGVGLPALGHGYWWTPLSAGLWASGLGSYLAVTAAGLLLLAPAEHRMGVRRAFTTLLVSQVGGLLLAVGLVRLAVLAGEPWLGALTRETALGALPGLLGAGVGLSRTFTVLWRRRLRLLLTVAIAISVMYFGHLDQIAQAFGAASGLVVVALLYDGAWPRAGLRASGREVRALVGMLVAVPALGGILAALVATSHGPMSLSSLLFATHKRWPGLWVQAAPDLLLLLCAYGLRRGRRLAWWLAVVINLVVLGVSIWVASAIGGKALLSASEAMVLSAVTLVVLLATRRRFDQTADGRAVRKLTATLAVALGVSCGVDMLFSNRFLPSDLLRRLLYLWLFLPFWIVVLGALTAFFMHTSTYRDADAAKRAREILRRGGSTLSYMSTWQGNAYWISADGRAAIAYRAIAGVAVTIGEPYGDPAALDSAITEFTRFCEHRGLQPCLYSVTAQTVAVTAQLGWKSVQIAEDTLLPLPCLQFSGKKWQGVRAAMNKAERESITAQWWSYPQMPPELVGQIREISAKWMADKGLPEMNFMLGGLKELNDPNIRCLVAVDADSKVHAITSWMPVYADGRPVGWTIDLMRRNTEPGAIRGVMEFLIATAALTFKEEGASFVSLSGAPLTRLDRGEQPCAAQRMLDMIGNAMEPAYGFQSLRHFKAKFQPVYEPLYMSYPDPAALGPIAIAISRAYLPHLTSRQGLRLLAKMRRPSGVTPVRSE